MPAVRQPKAGPPSASLPAKPDTSSRERAERLWQAREIYPRSKLFSNPVNPDPTDPPAFIGALSCLVAVHGKLAAPKKLEDAINKDGAIKKAAELHFFGGWLLLKGMPGLAGRRVTPPVAVEAFKTVAAIAAELLDREWLLQAGKKHHLVPSRRSGSGKVTRADLRVRWRVMYDEAHEADWFKPKLTTAKRLLDAYLRHISGLPVDPARTGNLKSKFFDAALGAINGGNRPPLRSKPKPATAKPVSVGAGAAPFAAAGPGTAPMPDLVVPLTYTSTAKRLEHRSPTLAGKKSSTLRYRPEAATSVQGRFRNQVVYRPDVAIRGNFSAAARIDRMILLFATRNPASGLFMHKALKAEAGASNLADDMLNPSSRWHLDWKGVIDLPPQIDPSLGAGRIFALQLQDPTPVLLAKVLDLIERRWGIVGKVFPFMIEVALDFIPRKNLPAGERLKLREQMVGLLQRHHHFEGKEWKSHDADARQSYGTSVSGKAPTPKLFASPGGVDRYRRDTCVQSDIVRQRLHHNRFPSPLFLDATLYKGTQIENLQFRIQHKIGNNRNRKTGTSKVLSEAERRARIEVEIAGTQRLEAFGLKAIGDLARVDFREVRNTYLQFWLCTAPEDVSQDALIRRHFRDRGLYGTEIMKQLIAYEEEQAAKAAAKALGGKVPRDRTGRGRTGTRLGWTEINEVVGDAMDALSLSWSRFEWPMRGAASVSPGCGT